MHTIGARLKTWRGSRKLTQPDAATHLSIPLRTYQNYEGNVRAPNTEAWQAFVRAGINTNWLLTGDGPMLLADLVAPVPAAAPKRAPPRINVEALAHAYAVTLQTAPKGETLEQSARKAVAFYQYCWERGLITEDGEGTGNEHGVA